MHTIEQQLLTSLENYSSKSIYVAYSGGVDSQVLLCALAHLKKHNQLTQDIFACHIHHGLSEHADDWQTFCRNQSALLDVPFITQNVDVKANAQQSLEAVAREARYQAFRTLVPKEGIIVTGHHLDDQAETILLALKRGAGVAGLSAMKVETLLYQRDVIRPLLGVSRKEIEAYAYKRDLSFIEDDSNTDESFDRNFLRHQVMPLLSQRWPSVASTFARSAQNCQQTQVLLDDLATNDLGNVQLTDNSLSLAPLLTLSIERFNNMMRYKLKHSFDVTPSKSQLEQLRKQLASPQDKAPELKLSNIVIRRFKGAVYITRDYQNISEWKRQYLGEEFNTSQFISLPDKSGELSVLQQGYQQSEDENFKGISHEVIAPGREQHVEIAFHHPNPKCIPEFRLHSKALKKVLQELNIPPWQRTRIPFLYYNNELVAAIGHFVCKEFKPQADSIKLTLNYSFPQDSR